MINKHIIYVAYGADCFVQEAAYSVLSLCSVVNIDDYRVTIVTDKGFLFHKLIGNTDNINILSVNDEKIKKWRGDNGYVHRAKPIAIQWAVQQVAKPDDLVIFVDSDTFFRKSPEILFKKIRNKLVVLDELEGTIDSCRNYTNSLKKLYRSIKIENFMIRGESKVIPLDTKLWNSGVIGFEFSQAGIFDDVVALIDDMYKKVPIVTVEQIALSIVLQDQGIEIKDDEDVIFHYHFFKEFRKDLDVFFGRYKNKNFKDKISKIGEIAPILRYVPKEKFHKHSKSVRKILKIIGLKWKPLPYPWEH